MTTNSNKPDIHNRDDIATVLTTFYTDAFSDPIIGFMFTDVANADLDEHVQLITKFWSSIIFKEGSYNGNAMQKHVDINSKVPLKPGHFTRWLFLFERALDAKFSGENADLMKKRARMIAESISDSLSKRRGESSKGVDMLSDLLNP